MKTAILLMLLIGGMLLIGSSYASSVWINPKAECQRTFTYINAPVCVSSNFLIISGDWWDVNISATDGATIYIKPEYKDAIPILKHEFCHVTQTREKRPWDDFECWVKMWFP